MTLGEVKDWLESLPEKCLDYNCFMTTFVDRPDGCWEREDLSLKDIFIDHKKEKCCFTDCDEP